MFTFTSEDGVRVHVHAWHPEGPVRGVVQIAHGMGEHGLRYAPLAAHLTARGYAVLAPDHRGHGLSMHAGPGHLGADGWNRLVDDLATLTRTTRERHPGVPVVLFGHSMGSFAAQQFLLDHAELVDAVALSGTTAVDALLTALAAAPRADHGAFGVFNAPFAPVRTEADWLSRDEAQVDAYLADPLCGFGLDLQGLAHMADAAGRLAAPGGIPAGLPVALFVGDRDPLNGRLAHSDLLVSRYREAGLTDLAYHRYEGARHEVLNETNRAEVVADLTAWIERVTS
ncbi:alpha/beta fold hydrolase [Streptomyces sp. NPDC056049]|uniref:alpha/beta fold hydrolase n=1 Tax=Streptomyces sp. NPDC056049 TaxID=3345693 RepID=UPI0035E29B9E